MFETGRQERRPGVSGDGNVCPAPVAIDRNVRCIRNLYSGNDPGTINDRRALDPCLVIRVMMPVLPAAFQMQDSRCVRLPPIKRLSTDSPCNFQPRGLCLVDALA